jgi:hypothetical protein
MNEDLVVDECKKKTEKFHKQCTQLRKHVQNMLNHCEDQRVCEKEYLFMFVEV